MPDDAEFSTLSVGAALDKDAGIAGGPELVVNGDLEQEKVAGDLRIDAATPTARELFRSDNLLVREISGFGAGGLVVTFDSYTDIRDLDRPGFGEMFLRAKQVDAIHVISRDNRWYQYPELPESVEKIRCVAQRYERTISYGSSMGGYAAIRFGAAVGAQAALALSPQFSIDPGVVPFEDRWLDDAKVIDFALERSWAVPFVDVAYIPFDPHDRDKRHVELFASRTHVVPIDLPNAGHPVTGFLAEIGLLQQAVLELASGTFDPVAYRRAARARRKGSAQFHSALASRARDPARQVALYQRALEIAPDEPWILMDLGLALCSLGKIAEARAACARAVTLRPGDPVLLCRDSEFYNRAGHWERAAAVMRDIIRRFPAVPAYEARLAMLESLIKGERLHRASLSRDVRETPRRRWSSTIRKWIPPRGDGQRLPIELRVTTTPSPPPFATSWRRHELLMQKLPQRPIDLMLVGDSLMQYWPSSCWDPLVVFNFGIAADKTQHTLWRLDRLYPRQIDTCGALVMLGTNNLGADDGPEAIYTGVEAVVKRLARIAPSAPVYVVGIPPCGPDFAFRDADRRRANQLLSASKLFRAIDVDEIITTGFDPNCTNYMDDHIHLSEDGYRVLTRFILGQVV